MSTFPFPVVCSRLHRCLFSCIFSNSELNDDFYFVNSQYVDWPLNQLIVPCRYLACLLACQANSLTKISLRICIKSQLNDVLIIFTIRHLRTPLKQWKPMHRLTFGKTHKIESRPTRCNEDTVREASRRGGH